LPSTTRPCWRRWPAAGSQQRGQHLRGLVGVVVDCLLAQDHQTAAVLFDQLEQHSRSGQRLDGIGRDHVDGAVRAHRQAIAQVCLRIGRADGGHHDFGRDALVAQSQRFFQRDFIEGIGGKLHAVGHDARAIGLDLDAHVEIDDALVADKNLHRRELPVDGERDRAILPAAALSRHSKAQTHVN
jgi:hypothetical protein